MAGEYCGYCFYNNVALAAAHALDAGLGRILIVDWDVHHGQGTQQMFYDDPRVLYFSIHRYEHGTFWPNLRQSDFDYIGEGKGKGFNFNVPLNAVGMTDADYLAIFQKILLPVAYEVTSLKYPLKRCELLTLVAPWHLEASPRLVVESGEILGEIYLSNFSAV